MGRDDPHRVLGVERTWTMGDIEHHYREQVREAHPDRHVHEGPDAVARADQRTRQLNEAMSQIREQHAQFAVPGQSSSAGPTPPGANQGGWMGTGTNPMEDWATGDGGDDFGIRFGWSLPDEERQRNRSSQPQPCPLCPESFTAKNDYLAHLHMVHHTDPARLAGQRRRRRPRQAGAHRESRFLAVLEWLGFVLCSAAVFALLGWRASMPSGEAGTLTPVLAVAAIAALAMAGRLLYSRFFDDSRETRRVKF